MVGLDREYKAPRRLISPSRPQKDESSVCIYEIVQRKGGEGDLTKQKQQELSSEGLKDLWRGKNLTGCTPTNRRNEDGV